MLKYVPLRMQTVPGRKGKNDWLSTDEVDPVKAKHIREMHRYFDHKGDGNKILKHVLRPPHSKCVDKIDCITCMCVGGVSLLEVHVIGRSDTNEENNWIKPGHFHTAGMMGRANHGGDSNRIFKGVFAEH